MSLDRCSTSSDVIGSPFTTMTTSCARAVLAMIRTALISTTADKNWLPRLKRRETIIAPSGVAIGIISNVVRGEDEAVIDIADACLRLATWPGSRSWRSAPSATQFGVLSTVRCDGDLGAQRSQCAVDRILIAVKGTGTQPR
jgi:hypothetical protein